MNSYLQDFRQPDECQKPLNNDYLILFPLQIPLVKVLLWGYLLVTKLLRKSMAARWNVFHSWEVVQSLQLLFSFIKSEGFIKVGDWGIAREIRKEFFSSPIPNAQVLRFTA